MADITDPTPAPTPPVPVTVESVPQDVKDLIIKQATGLVYGNIDAKLDSMGYKKPNGEKTSDFIARVLEEKSTEIKTLSEAKPDLSNYEKQIGLLKEDIKAEKQRAKELEEGFGKKLLQKDITSQVDLLTSEITVPSHLTDQGDIKAFVDSQREMILGRITSNYTAKEVDGVLQFIGKDNQIVTNEERESASVKDLVSKDFSYLFKKGSAPVDPPVGGKPSGKPSGEGTGTFKTFEEVTASADKKGFAVGSPDWSKYVTEKLSESGIE